MALQREFLGWDEMPLERAATWLCDNFGEDMSDVLVAPPGGRPGRILFELLARKAGPGLRPPTVVTAGVLSDALLQIGGIPAGRLVRTLAWKQALAGLDAEALERIVARPPEPGDLAGWMRIAEEVRGLFGEVAAEGLDFGDVAEAEILRSVECESNRWRSLALAQTAMLSSIERLGFIDPHVGRLQAIQTGSIRETHRVVLVGVVEMNALLRRTLELCRGTVTAIVFAPEAESENFDSFGCLIPEQWSTRKTSLDPQNQWFVVDGAVEQADRVAKIIAGWDGQYSAEQISVGLADREVAPSLTRTLGSHGIVTRDAAGTSVSRTRPAMLLEALGQFLNGERFADLAKLVRHSDFEAAIRQQHERTHGAESTFEELQPVNLLDDYYNEHLPWKVSDVWLSKSASRYSRSLNAGMGWMWNAICELLGDLRNRSKRRLNTIVPELRTLLDRIYGEQELDPGVEQQRILIHGLSKLGDGLREIEGLPDDLAPDGSVSSAIDLLLRAVTGEEIPPPAAREGQPTIELFGWLELALDDAPALVVTGFEDGKVPESIRGHAYLPNRLRQNLGLLDNERRLARDLYATELLLKSRDRVAFVSGRRSLAGDPQLPSRIVFHCEDAEIVPRVKYALTGSSRKVARLTSDADRVRELPRLDSHAEIENISVTEFRLFLKSPYEYYLSRIARLKTLDDRVRELDPLHFGSLAHAVVQRFGEKSEMREETDAGKIKAFLAAEVVSLGSARYGKSPMPAVHLQLEQLKYRLGFFAEQQAARRLAGWEICHVEWSPEAGYLEVSVDDKPIRIRGRIDRIDYHPGKKCFAIWDYKTGDTVKQPLVEHRKSDDAWRDLQLPLYCRLARELIGDEPPAEIGYIAICREPAKINFMNMDKWSRSSSDTCFEEAMQSADHAVHDVVRRIREAAFFTAEGFEPYEPIFKAIGGAALVGVEQASDEGEG